MTTIHEKNIAALQAYSEKPRLGYLSLEKDGSLKHGRLPYVVHPCEYLYKMVVVFKEGLVDYEFTIACPKRCLDDMNKITEVAFQTLASSDTTTLKTLTQSPVVKIHDPKTFVEYMPLPEPIQEEPTVQPLTLSTKSTPAAATSCDEVDDSDTTHLETLSIHDPESFHGRYESYYGRFAQPTTDKIHNPKSFLGRFFTNLFTKSTPATATASFDKAGEFGEDSGIDTTTSE